MAIRIADLEGRDTAIANFQANGEDIDIDSDGGNEDLVLQHQSHAQISFICGWMHVVITTKYRMIREYLNRDPRF
jgi:hypothetical protein